MSTPDGSTANTGHAMKGKLCLVTGANQGIGKEVARGLLHLGADVVLACRNAERGGAAVAELARSTGGRVELMIVDLAEQASIRTFAARFLATHGRLDVLVNNAAVWPSQREITSEGRERTFATNVLGYFLLTSLLLPLLADSGAARVVNVASNYAGGLDLADLEFEKRPFTGAAAYRQSKQCDRLLTWAFARRIARTSVTANAVHPGTVDTNLLRAGMGMGFGKPPEEGARTVIWLAASPELARENGRYFMDRAGRRCEFRNPRVEDALFGRCVDLTGHAA